MKTATAVRLVKVEIEIPEDLAAHGQQIAENGGLTSLGHTVTRYLHDLAKDDGLEVAHEKAEDYDHLYLDRA